MWLSCAAAMALVAGCGRGGDPAAGTRPQSTLAPARTGDEGMWTLDNLPLADLKARYDFVPSAEWTRHVQLSAVHVGGASGAFVSPDGLILTNHHVALGQLQKLSTPQKNYVRDGFLARRREDELRCPDQEMKVLVSMEEVTRRVVEAVDPGASQADQNRQRKAQIARIEKESQDKTRLQSHVISLYQGGEYWLYRFKKYTDVRLVMAPEFQAAFFGGDADNFTYPRYCIDFAFFRVYEDGKPAKVEHWLKFKASGAAEGELVFVAGHPGSTHRLRTVAQLEFDRDARLPMSLAILARRREVLYEYARRGTEQARQVQSLIFGVENGLKGNTGRYRSLMEPEVFKKLAQAEAQLRAQVKARPDLEKTTGDAWDRIAGAMKEAAGRYKQSVYRPLGGSRLADIAQQLVTYAGEIQKPNDRRYEEFRDSALESTQRRLFSPAPIYPELEEHLFACALADAQKALGPGDPVIIAALNGRRPEEVAKDLIGGTHLADPAVRKELAAGGKKAIEASTDPLIAWARRLDPMWRELREWHESHVQSVELLEGHKIAQARFAIYGKNAYPDATSSLRLTFGRVLGYDSGTTKVPYKTTMYGMLERAAAFDNKAPFELPPEVAKKRDKIELGTPLNFVTTHDIIGGNSGSPVIDRQGRYVGLIFDSNLEGLARAYVYNDRAGRAISVHARTIMEALTKIYDAPDLAKELEGSGGE